MGRSPSSPKEGEWIMAIIKRYSSKATPNKIVDYLTDQKKTETQLISGKDCSPENVVSEFKATKELYGKNDGVQYHHIVQSFSPEDDINPRKAHELGRELAEKQFKGHEVFIVTHKDKNHIHNHLMVNSVSFENGMKFKATNKSLWDIKRESNRQCERENLKTIDLNKKAPERVTSGELRMILRGEVPWKEELKQCINFAKEKTRSLKEMGEYLKDNFGIETRITKKTISYKHPDRKASIRGSKLGANFDKEVLENEFIGKEKGIDRARVQGAEYRSTGADGEVSKISNSRANSPNQQGKSEHGKATRERQSEDFVKGENKRKIHRNEQGSKGVEIDPTGRNSKNIPGYAGGNPKDREKSHGISKGNEGARILPKNHTQSYMERKGETVRSATSNNLNTTSSDIRSISPSNLGDVKGIIVNQYKNDYPAIKYISQESAEKLFKLNKDRGQPYSIKEIKGLYKEIGKALDKNYTPELKKEFNDLSGIVNDLRQSDLKEKSRELKGLSKSLSKGFGEQEI